MEAESTSETSVNFYQTTRATTQKKRCNLFLLFAPRFDGTVMGHTKIHTEVGFEVLTAVSTKMAVFWVVAPCSLVEVYQRFRGPCYLSSP
jgi:hypothetical protein